MKQNIISDDYTIINTQGIRFVEKVDYITFEKTQFRLVVTYKGDKMEYRYINAELRDAQFNRLRLALETEHANK